MRTTWEWTRNGRIQLNLTDGRYYAFFIETDDTNHSHFVGSYTTLAAAKRRIMQYINGK